MSALSSKLRSLEGDRLAFLCPGCSMMHQIAVGSGPGPRWSWNGDAERPTFSPSILVRYDHWVPPADTLEMSAKIRAGEVTQTQVHDVCHSFVTDGRIQFLGDCTHALAGQTVDIPDWDSA